MMRGEKPTPRCSPTPFTPTSNSPSWPRSSPPTRSANAIDFAASGLDGHILPAGLALRVPVPCACSGSARRATSVRYVSCLGDTLASIASRVYGGLTAPDWIRDSNGGVLDAGTALLVPLLWPGDEEEDHARAAALAGRRGGRPCLRGRGSGGGCPRRARRAAGGGRVPPTRPWPAASPTAAPPRLRGCISVASAPGAGAARGLRNRCPPHELSASLLRRPSRELPASLVRRPPSPRASAPARRDASPVPQLRRPARRARPVLCAPASVGGDGGV
ncbi:hypothetical protein VPH35_050921 [Triticum aestivum]|uniref:LysM domain-containing protein n=1 Tax=Triticum aestivum TaxID=4565 RepID=A0A077RYQ5_WHEAT|nr:unnamed protein product [Triticum aestivum]CDM82267.1 unnamed protein product [Triticum aestivum]